MSTSVSRQVSTTPALPALSVAISIIQAQAQTQNNRDTTRSIKLRSNQARPNVYVSMHYRQTIQELGNTSNANVLVREFKYKEIKDQIYNTNYNNPERNLLLQQSILMSTRLLVQNGYPDYPYITKQMQDIQRSCPKLFDIVLPRSEQSSAVLGTAIDSNLEASTLVCLSRYSNVAVGKRLNQDYCRDFFNLPVRMNKVGFSTKNKISNVYTRDYENTVTLIDLRPIKWQTQAAFDDKASQRRIVLGRRDFVRYIVTNPTDNSNNQIGRIDQMFIHESLPSKPRLFFCITPAHPVPYLTIEGQSLIDSISECKIRKIGLAAEEIIIGLPAISGKRVYAIPYQNYVSQYLRRVVGKVQSSDNVLFADQDI